MIEHIIGFEPGGPGSGNCDFRLAPDVMVLFVSDGSARILDFGGDFYALSESGAFMLRETLEGGVGAAVDGVVAAYDIDTASAHRDLDDFLRDLERRGVVLRREVRERRSGWPARFSRHALRWLLAAIESLPLPLGARAGAMFGAVHAGIGLLGWPATVRIVRDLYPAAADRAAPDPAAADPVAIDRLVRSVAARSPVPLECKERALCCWALLRRTGLPARLVVGVSLFPLESHCWCEVADRVLTDYPDRCERFVPIATYR